MTIERPMFPPVVPTRRHFLSQAAGVAAGGSVLALATISAAADAAAPVASLASSGVDPIFALIADHRQLQAAWLGLCRELEEAEHEASEEHGPRPIPLIHWRGYHIGGSEIEDRREQLLERKIDSATVEQEYLDAKAREQTKRAAEKAWDVHTGLAAKREEMDRAERAESGCAERLSRTKPTTPAGAAALIQHVIDDEICGEIEWHMTALDTAVAALNKMTRGAAS